MPHKDVEHLGFIIRKLNDTTFVVISGDKQYHSCDSEKKAKTWIFKFRRMMNKTNGLKNIPDDIVAFNPSDKQEGNTNIVAISVAVETNEKYIKISVNEKGSPQIDVKNLDANETLGLMKRADYMITNNVLRHGTV